jgi:hypothetical protein
VEGTILLKKQIDTSKNIVGVIGNPKCTLDQTIVIGAHLDHLGLGGENSLEPTKSGIHHGADDNASGVAALLETARILKGQKNLRSCIVFAAFTAEEMGTVGSTRLMELYKKQGAKPKAMLNMDMVGRLTGNAPIVFGVETAKEWRSLLKDSCNELMLECKASGDGYGPSDQMPFYLGGVPVLHFFTGSHNDYHRVSDVVEKVNATGIVQVAELVADLAKELSHPLKPVTYLKVSSTSSMGALRGVGDRHSYGAYLGTIPDYADMGSISGANRTSGVKLSGVRPDSPSEKAGIKAGDIITAITVYEAEPGVKLSEPKTHRISNIDEYMFVLTELKPGTSIEVEVIRAQKTEKLQAVVGKKQ